jgi:hypothetical protein
MTQREGLIGAHRECSHPSFPRFLHAASLWLVLSGAGIAQTPPLNKQPPGFDDFTQRVQQYMKLRKELPNQRTTKRQKQIVDRRHSIAEAIREARPAAKQGDIFTPESTVEFLKIIRGTLQGSNAANVRKTIRQGEPLTGVHLTVNGAYPEHLPRTTMPPTLLLRLPRLPDKLAYRIVGHDFVLQDTEARLVVDLIPGALP